MTVCGTASRYAKIGLIFHVLGAALFVSGFATMAWMASQTSQTTIDINVGLFRMQDCSSGACDTKDVTDTYKNGSRTGTIAIMSIAMVCMVACLLMYSVYVAQEQSRGKCFAIVVIVCEFTTATFICIGMIIWLVQIPSGYFASYSFGLAVLGGGFFIGAGCLLIADVRQMRANKRTIRKPIRVTPPPRYNEYPPSPPPKLAIPPTPRSPDLYVHRSRRWDDRKYHMESSLDNYSPRDNRDRSPRTPQRVRVHVRSTTPISLASTSISNPRRYGTPKFSQRYDNRAR
ncbi:hypothetical protein FSP39_019497 [Pinctada imbricata]|uniref:Uncharacterized protein n=1 Tax=Pinctada imbricata TaxID=66713 RepID=A0AA88XVY9_PINIB|nr:hypothetical protein FSP39_019497 [Pinctada imbricata]